MLVFLMPAEVRRNLMSADLSPVRFDRRAHCLRTDAESLQKGHRKRSVHLGHPDQQVIGVNRITSRDARGVFESLLQPGHHRLSALPRTSAVKRARPEDRLYAVADFPQIDPQASKRLLIRFVKRRLLRRRTEVLDQLMLE
jgi:hypothetical protein